MADFRKLASNARAKYEAATQKVIQDALAVEAAKKSLSDAKIATLREHVLPLLEQAKSDLDAESIPLDVDVHNGGNYPHWEPAISAVCRGPARKNDKNRFTSEKIIFEASGTTITARSEGDSATDRVKCEIGSSDVASVFGLVEKSIELALAGYFAALSVRKMDGAAVEAPASPK